MSVPIVRELSPFDKIRKKYGQDFLTRLDTWSKEDSGHIPYIHIPVYLFCIHKMYKFIPLI